MNLWDLPPQPLRDIRDVYLAAQRTLLCELGPYAAYVLARTPPGILVGGALLLFKALACDGDPNEVPRLQFSGGQCPTFYTIEGTYSITNFPGEPWIGRGLGPISSVQLVEDAPGVPDPPFPPRRLLVTFATGPSPVANNQGGLSEFLSWEITSVTRDDGQPDNCGSPGPGYPVPLPNPGPGPYPPYQWSEDDSPRYFNIELPDATVIAYPVYIGPIQVDANFQFPITIDLNGSEWNIGADLTSEPSSGGDLGEILDDLEQILDLLQNQGYTQFDRSLLEYIYGQHFAPRQIILTTGECEDPPTTVEVSGNGFGLLASALTQESFARYSQAAALCPGPPPDPVGRTLIFAASVTGNNTELFSGPIGPEVHSIEIVIEDFDPVLVPQSRAFPGGSYRKFGNLSFTLEGIDGPGDYVYIQDENQFLTLPPRGVPGRLRVQCKQSVSFGIYDTGDRI